MINIRGLYKSFNHRSYVLNGVDLDIYEGETITIIGGSGCGKTVLLKHIVGLLRPEKGSITVDEVILTQQSDRQLWDIQNKFGYLFQGAALFDSLTVEENVSFGIQHRGYSASQIKEIVNERLGHVGLPGTNHLKPAELSGGMRKRVALARAIARDPKYMLYDEPTTGLDPIMADAINELILHLQRSLNITSIVVTHDMKSAYRVSNRIAMLSEGQIIEVGTPEQIQSSTNPYVKQFITGSSHGPIPTVTFK